MYSKRFAGSILALSAGKALAGGVQWAGVNVAGMDFGCDTTGTCALEKVVIPLHQYNGADGAAQMRHFADNDKFNAFRLPVGWQYLVNNQLGGKLDSTNFPKYDALVKACLATGAHCIIDIHNYARWDGAIIGQGGPKDEQFADLWSQLMTYYASEPNVVVGMVNEPHDIPDMDTWAASCQAVVTAVRKAGAAKHTILLPGTGYTSAGSFVSSGSADALSKVKNPDGSHDNLVFDVHKYLDADNSGTHTSCVGNSIDAAFKPLATWLKQNNRMALLSEIGGGSSDESCMQDVCQALEFLNQNSDAYLGYLGWGAGSFDDTYELSLTPKDNGAGSFTDVPLLTKCFAAQFNGGSGKGPSTDNSTIPVIGGNGSGSSSGSGSGSLGGGSSSPTTMATSYIAVSTTSAASGSTETGESGTTSTTGLGSGSGSGTAGGTGTGTGTGAGQDTGDEEEECEADYEL